MSVGLGEVRQNGSTCRCCSRSPRADGAELAAAAGPGHGGGSGAGWAGLTLPWRWQRCHGSLGLLPAAAQGPGREQQIRPRSSTSALGGGVRKGLSRFGALQQSRGNAVGAVSGLEQQRQVKSSLCGADWPALGSR